MSKHRDEMPQLSSGDAEQLADHLADLAKSHKPIVGGLRAVASEATSKRLASALDWMADSVERGQSLDDVMKSASGRLRGYVSGLVVASLESGNFADALSELVEHHRAVRRLRRSVLSALAYPMLVLSLTFAIFVGAQVFVIPEFDDMFQEFELSLPTSTLILIQSNRWFNTVGLWMMLGVVGLAMGAMITLRVVGGGTRWSRIWATVPIVGALSHFSGVAGWTRMLAILIEQGIPLPNALRLAADAVQNANIRQVSRDLARGTESGQDLSVLLATNYRLPALLAPLVQAGQHDGSLGEALRTASELYEMRVRLRAVLLRSILPPIVFLFVGIFVGLIFTGLMMPLVGMLQGLTGI